ncbi:hypothetical protein [Rhizobium sp. RU35A]|uniref:hypothetical protein n=1 Tax=Rhizobium sp. RU35A TaxID=1907414 RepID=UPI00122D2660|nr:hypothetical protein [Rhizobium sp. RU35A]
MGKICSSGAVACRISPFRANRGYVSISRQLWRSSMHNVYRLPDQRAFPMTHPSTELEVITTTRQLLERTSGQNGDDRMVHALPPSLLSFGKAGLLGTSVPADLGGADIANAVIAEMIALAAASDTSLAQRLVGHFLVVEAIRAADGGRQTSEWLTRALAGDIFLLAADPIAEETVSWPALVAGKAGFLLPAEALPRQEEAGPVWLAVPCIDPAGRRLLALLAPIEDDAAGSGMAVPAGSLVELAKDDIETTTLTRLASLLQAAVDLGQARRVFNELALSAEEKAGNPTEHPAEFVRLGELAARLDGVSALIERAGQHVDSVQVDPTPQLALQASLSCRSACVMAAEILKDLDAARLPSQSDTWAMRNELAKRRLGQLHVRGAIPARWPFAY